MSEFDVVVYGASGFTGRLVAEYLQASAPNDLSWAVAGRNRAKLEAVMAEVGAEVPILTADANDPDSLEALAKKATVVCTTVGPYTKYGMPLVEACVAAGAGYVDLTGEAHFVHDTIRLHEAKAKETGARIVHACGFDSIPSDLGTLTLAKHFEAKGQKLGRVRFRLGGSSGGFSGGTVASMFELVRVAKDPRVRRVLGDPYALIPEGAPRGNDKNEPFSPQKDADLGKWTAPFIMASINTRIVRRSAAQLGYGEKFSYEERMNTGKGVTGMLAATGISVGLGGFLATVGLPGLKSLYKKLLPSPGEGPSREKREAGFFKIYIHGESDAGERATATVIGQKDPGYGETSKMLAESAICLATGDVPKEGGIFTPAVAMGMTLVERLRAAGMTFDVSAE